MQVFGSLFGLTFLVLNLPINLYAGRILGNAADVVEKRLASLRDTNGLSLNDNIRCSILFYLIIHSLE